MQNTATACSPHSHEKGDIDHMSTCRLVSLFHKFAFQFKRRTWTNAAILTQRQEACGVMKADQRSTLEQLVEGATDLKGFPEVTFPSSGLETSLKCVLNRLTWQSLSNYLNLFAHHVVAQPPRRWLTGKVREAEQHGGGRGKEREMSEEINVAVDKGFSVCSCVVRWMNCGERNVTPSRPRW